MSHFQQSPVFLPAGGTDESPCSFFRNRKVKKMKRPVLFAVCSGFFCIAAIVLTLRLKIQLPEPLEEFLEPSKLLFPVFLYATPLVQQFLCGTALYLLLYFLIALPVFLYIHLLKRRKEPPPVPVQREFKPEVAAFLLFCCMLSRLFIGGTAVICLAITLLGTMIVCTLFPRQPTRLFEYLARQSRQPRILVPLLILICLGVAFILWKRWTFYLVPFALLYAAFRQSYPSSHPPRKPPNQKIS